MATNLAAGTFSGGVYTATANAALGTQDGVTLAVGDIIVLPVGTLTTLVGSAANSGPYQVTSLGATGAKVVLTRPAKWSHGDTITPSTVVRVGAEGTLFRNTEWFAQPATATKVVGTDDPVLYPKRVITQVTLVAGTVTLQTVPIRATAGTVVDMSLAGGTPAGTTTSFDLKLSGGLVAGGVGTGSVVIEAHSVKGTKVATDVSVLNVSIMQ